MGELKFQKLTPTREVDLSGYEDAFQYIFDDNDIRNIAISGAYSSGKSSVIESYEKKNPNKRFLHLSLAHFRALDDESAEETDTIKETEIDSEKIIEGKMLNQLIQQIPAEKIPQTNFRIKRSIGRKKPAFISGMLCIFIALFLYCTRFDEWRLTIDTLNDSPIKNFLSLTTISEARLVGLVLMLLIIGLSVYEFIKVQHSKNILRKISVQGNEIELFADNNDSYFDKYLNEVLYLFENTDADGIVFEDIDRFDNHMIFERLREINTLTNIRLKNKKGCNGEKPLRFFYLLRDDIFENKDRAKFFDYILPIVPVLDSSNSYNKIKEYLESASVYEQFDDHFLRGISLYIDDLRIVKNIFNEFLIYNRKLNGIELDVNRLFAIIVYKNIFPRDFANLQLNRGFVHTLFESKDRLIAERLNSINEEISLIEERISYYEREHLESQAELDLINNSKYNDIDRHGYYERERKRKEYEAWYQDVYQKRKQAIEDRKEGNISELKKLYEQKKEEISGVENLQLADLLNRKNIDEVFRVNYVNEIDQTDHFYAIKVNPYFALLKYLISRGYIDESYTDYMTFFYPNSLSLNDKVFLRSVADRTEKPASYLLDNPGLVIENLNKFDFSQRETLNYALTEYILLTHKEELIQSMIGQLEIDKRMDYVSGYMRSGKELIPFAVAINRYWPSMLHETIASHTLSNDLLKSFIYLTLEHVDADTLNKVDIEGCLKDYISNDPHFLIADGINTAKVGEALSALQVSFTRIDSCNVNEQLFDYVYQNNLYDINKSNILLMIMHKCEEQDVQRLLPKLFTFIFTHQEYALSEYILANRDYSLSVYLDMYDGNINDTSETITELMNSENIDSASKEAYVERLGTVVEKIDKIVSSDDQKILIARKKVNYSSDNIIAFFRKFGLTNELISFINSNPRELDYLSDCESEGLNKFSDACLVAEGLSDEKYRQIMENLCDCIQKFSVEGISNEKIKILIDLKKIEMNPVNLRFIRKAYPTQVLVYIRNDVDRYISVATTSDFSIEEMKEILEWPEVDYRKKVELLKHTNQPVSVENKPLSDEVLKYVLENNLHEADIPWLLRNYSKFSNEVRKTVFQVISNMVVQITSKYLDDVDDVLLDQLFRTESIGFEEKVLLLAKSACKMSKEKICDSLRCLGADKIADNISGGKKKVKVTNESKYILTALLNAGVISEPVPAVDGKTYKTIRYCIKKSE